MVLIQSSTKEAAVVVVTAIFIATIFAFSSTVTISAFAQAQSMNQSMPLQVTQQIKQ
jgi:hypothetical protein